MGADQHFDLRDHVASTLDWWRDAGVDALVDDAPRDWLTPSVAAPPPLPAEAIANADALPDTLEAFLAWRTGSDAPERGWGAQPLSPAGNPAASLHIVVDLPDEGNAWLSPAADRLLDRMLAAIGLDRGAACIHGLAWSRPAAGTLAAEEERALAEQALHLLALAAPKRVLLFGQTTSRALLGTDGARKRGLLHGINHRGAELSMVASWHPRFLLDRPAAKADAWRDLQLLVRGTSL